MKLKDFLKEHKKVIRWGASILLGLWTLKTLQEHVQAQKMDQISKRKGAFSRQQLLEYKQNHHQPCTLPQELQNQILNSNIAQLKQLLLDKKTTVKQLLQVFIDRILKIACWDNLNIITDINFIDALKEADLQDQEIQADPQVINKFPLFGIPVSVKETFLLKGFDSTLGIGANCFKPQSADGTQVAQIKAARGIIFVKTNVPQLVMTFESVNPVYGTSKNPWNPLRAVGGSSGGEGAIAAARGSVVGIGSDVGGSIRIPAAFCGVCGFKPSSGRVPDMGEQKISIGTYGQIQLKISRGPIARCVDDLVVMQKVLFDQKIYHQLPRQIKDPYFDPIEFAQYPNKQKLRIGYFDIFDGLIPPNCMRRAVHEACQALEAKGHEIVKFYVDPEIQHFIACCFLKVVVADGGMRTHQDALGGENYIKEYELLIQDSNTSIFVKKYILAPLFKLFRQKTLLHYNENSKVDVYQYLVDSGKRKENNIKFIQEMNHQGIDALISPAFGIPAVQHGNSKYLAFAAIYTWMYNVLDLPAGSVPITLVQEGNDTVIEGKERTIDIIYLKMKAEMSGAVGLPVNVQVASYPFKDEMVLRVMKEIEESVQFKQKYPYPQ